MEIVSRSKTTPPLAVASVNVLARVARLLEIPIILSVVPEGGRTPELIPELVKETTDSFENMAEVIESLGLLVLH